MKVPKKTSYYYYLGIFSVSTIFILTPLFFAEDQLRHIAESSSLGRSIKQSITLKILEGVNVGCSLPMMVEMLLDKATNVPNMDIANRSSFQLISIMAGLLYLCLNDKYYMPYLYICCFSTRFMGGASIFLHAVSQGVIAKKWRISSFFFIAPCFSLGLVNILITVSLVISTNIVISVILMLIIYISAIAFISFVMYWIFTFWQHYRLNNNTIGHGETKELVYMAGLIVFVVSIQSINLAYNWSPDWVNTNADIFVAYVVVMIVMSIILNVLPSRLLRKMSEVIIFDFFSAIVYYTILYLLVCTWKGH